MIAVSSHPKPERVATSFWYFGFAAIAAAVSFCMFPSWISPTGWNDPGPRKARPDGLRVAYEKRQNMRKTRAYCIVRKFLMNSFKEARATATSRLRWHEAWTLPAQRFVSRPRLIFVERDRRGRGNILPPAPRK